MNRILQMFQKFLNYEKSFEDRSSIDFSGPESLLYREADGRSMEICWYWQKGAMRARFVRRQDVHSWLGAHARELVSDAKKNEILEKIRAFCAKHRIDLDVVQ